VRDLAPADLESATLVGALERVADRTALAAGGGLTVTVEASGQARPLPVPVETALLRIAQSALANVVQHAGASRAAVTLSFLGDAVALDVVDDGRGFDPRQVVAGRAGAVPGLSRGMRSVVGQEDGEPGAGDEASVPRSGFGLTAMRSRVAELGGTFSLESSPGEGTALAVHLPLDPQEDW
jgi:signal transduction histidine kinase